MAHKLVKYIEQRDKKILADERKKILAEVKDICKWKDDGEGNYETDCGGLFTITRGTPKENKMKYCCYCGKILKEMEG
jgi:hypothetical protein